MPFHASASEQAVAAGMWRASRLSVLFIINSFASAHYGDHGRERFLHACVRAVVPQVTLAVILRQRHPDGPALPEDAATERRLHYMQA